MTDPRADLPVPNRHHPGEDRASHAPPPPAHDTGVVFEPPAPRRARVDRGMRSDLGLVGFLVAAAVLGIVVWNVAGGVTRSMLHPPPTQPGVAIGPTATPHGKPTATAATAEPSSSDAP